MNSRDHDIASGLWCPVCGIYNDTGARVAGPCAGRVRDAIERTRNDLRLLIAMDARGYRGSHGSAT